MNQRPTLILMADGNLLTTNITVHKLQELLSKSQSLHNIQNPKPGTKVIYFSGRSFRREGLYIGREGLYIGKVQSYQRCRWQGKSLTNETVCKGCKGYVIIDTNSPYPEGGCLTHGKRLIFEYTQANLLELLL